MKSYEQLVQLYPEMEEYQMYYAQSLYKAGEYALAQKVCLDIEGENLQEKVQHRVLFFSWNDSPSFKS